MTPERWQEVERLFAEALGKPPASRRQWLAEQNRLDPSLAAEVASLLDADDALAAGTNERIVHGARGRYRLLERLGQGGTSTVYLAEVLAGSASGAGLEDAGLETPAAEAGSVAVKMLRANGDPRLVERFVLEAEVLARVDHPGIARLVDAGTTERGRPFVVTALVEGEPIDRYCARHRLGIPARLRLFVAVCQAVHAAHRALVIHRDLKPGNILVTGDAQPVLLDFGLARRFDSVAALRQGAEATETGRRMLTLSCASPEQVRGEPLTTQTDVYGLGALLYRLLAGRAPFAAWHDRPAELVRAICEQDPQPPSRAALEADAVEFEDDVGPRRWTRRLRGDLDAIVALAMRKRPERRYASVKHLADDVERHLDGLPVRARRGDLRYRAVKLLRRHRLAAATGAAFALGLLAVSLTAIVQERQTAYQRDRAELSLDFLVEMLSSADPAHTGGDTLTARQILDAGTQRIENELGDQPDIQARLMDAVGTVYFSIGDFEQAEAILSRALGMRQTLYGPGPKLAVAASLEHLGDLRQEQGQHARAEALYRQALVQRRALLGEHDLLVASSLGKLADALRDQGEYEQAEALFRQALATERAQLGDSHLEVAETINNLGMLLHDRGDLDGAEPLYRQALGLRRRLLHGDHPAIASSLQNLASLLRQQRRFDQAAPLFEEALAMAERLHGARSTEVGVTLQNLGLLRLDRGDLEQAESLFERALAIDRENWGDEHPNIATNLHHLGLVKARQGKLPQAESLFRQSIDRYRKTLGPKHPWLAFPLLGLGLVLVDQERYPEAEAVLAESIAIRRDALGAGHWRVAEVENAYGFCLVRLGRKDEGMGILKRSLAALHTAFEDDDPRVVDAEERLGQALRDPR